MEATAAVLVTEATVVMARATEITEMVGTDPATADMGIIPATAVIKMESMAIKHGLIYMLSITHKN
jgi:hypothetical protein